MPHLLMGENCTITDVIVNSRKVAWSSKSHSQTGWRVHHSRVRKYTILLFSLGEFSVLPSFFLIFSDPDLDSGS